ncbi:mandelate racemase/muconate lactonizing protein [Fibrisoma limi BUZ 3]|uniref:Mandelate racemase/muconate lactonizing protein n=1 Tax=Fibrisoma limi BUZ 3 TaxID=1185876 RepID=I2GGA2_9BACT|nr:mandelate racemase/muconate lactonizing enzyme family protein [Fibrisoma limi]CCH52927.1 mandelate racemase/muconate lactonizing protein [Fibrisoma limi BUZ 3]
MNRRHFLSLLPAFAFPGSLLSAAPAMKVTKVETFYWKSRTDAPWWPHWTWVRVHTDTGLVGLGETYPRNAIEAEAIHSYIAPMLLGRDPRDIESIWRQLYQRADYEIAGGAETRAISAVDLALWDLLGKSLNTPVYRLIGGLSNPQVRLYNTCFPYKYDFNKEPEKIMREVLDKHGVKAIKIWPFDRAALHNRGQYVTQADLDEALMPVRKLRDAFGDSIDILIEFHGHWNVPAAIRIAKALEPYKPMWLEDMLMPGQYQQYRQLAEATSLPLTIGERMAGKLQFESLMESRAAKFIMFDVCWCGGLSEARKITAMADAYQLPFAPHTAGGPLLFHASTHLSAAMTNCAIQESCQRFYESDWATMLVNPLMPRDGMITPPDAPGFGMEVKPEVWTHPAVVKRESIFTKS